ncbi:MAG: LPS export ABC transporter permease LptG [Gammaproteobacteria bacterium]|nr:LPS export ABC transporter permease LptG [Gammaproteobacteria bacterium]
MKILDNYIGKSVASSMLVVLSVLLALFTLFGFLDELKDVGKGNYGVGQAILYILLTLPSLAYQLTPMTALLGCTIGLGMLAGNSELTAIRSAGVSLERIIWSVLKVGIYTMVVMVLVGEWIAPVSGQYAQTMRSVAKSNSLSLKGSQGLWAKDGTQYINVREILPGRRLGSVFIYEIDEKHRVTHILHAESAVYKQQNWELENVKHTYFNDNQVTSTTDERYLWQTTLSPELLNVVTVKSRTLSVWGLYQYIQYLENNGLSAEQYKQTFWSKITLPAVTLVMVLLSIPFVFGPLRSVGVGHRVLAGALVGIGFHLISQMSNYLGLVLSISPVLSVLLPTALAAVVVGVLLRRIH